MTRKSILTVVAGIVMVMAALWLGSYFMVNLESQHWARFPTLFTSFFASAVGLALIIEEVG